MDMRIRDTSLIRKNMKKQEWSGESPDIFQKSFFAGHEMMAIQRSDDQPELYELFYMDYSISGFRGIEDAKNYAPLFARTVLETMLSDIF